MENKAGSKDQGEDPSENYKMAVTFFVAHVGIYYWEPPNVFVAFAFFFGAIVASSGPALLYRLRALKRSGILEFFADVLSFAGALLVLHLHDRQYSLVKFANYACLFVSVYHVVQGLMIARTPAGRSTAVD
jgi:hypothetical protein